MNKLSLPIIAIALWAVAPGGCAASNGDTAAAESMLRTSHLVLDATPN